ncbi:glycosyltransferase [Simiduia agarivorans]|uniref:Glycosyltransferase n=1 Tax=Simiduia agarivorans (strain DSM 21679 / JCM 13881 / BCRC 17597 / SA1) TaxID=1117647 RepID=K4KJ56_SIMAS|nr:glycosyltransferase family 4 protein [Simiduia agarivorans]AFU98215.1 hypothetical protein M5M_05040 [Simiduia agarivorans SA1 = DSM 21679]
MQQTLLIIGYVWPEPTSSAAGSRIIQLIHWAQSAGYRVLFGSAAERGDTAEDLDALGVESVPLALNCSSFDRLVSALQPAVAIFDRFVTEEQFGWRLADASPGTLRVLDTEDLHCLRAGREQAIKAGRPVLDLADEDLFTELARRELAAIYRCDLSLMISDAEIALLVQRMGVPESLLHHCPFMETPVSGETLKGFDDRAHMVFIGNYRHAPNWDAVRYLREIWPAIRRALPDAEMHVYGAYQPKKALQLHSDALGFLIKGWARQARETLGQYRLCVAPLRFGAGIKGKLADAWATGTPSVTTAIGAEGMGQGEWPGGLVDRREQWAQVIVGLYTQRSAWNAAQRAALQRFNQLFDCGLRQAELSACIDTLRAQLTQHRQRNIVGAILHEQKHRSTEFMSRWIEAKSQP